MLEARPAGPIERCPGCGRMIEMPCLACQAEGHRLAGPARKFPATPTTEADLSLELDRDQRGRMESLRAAKIAAGEYSPQCDERRPAPIEERVFPQDVLRGGVSEGVRG